MKHKNECGMLTVEATLALVPFLMVILGIISFINIYMVHNRIQYAIFQVGSELSAYTYLYEALSIRNADKNVQNDADIATKELDTMIDYTSQFLNNTMAAKESYTNVINSNNYSDLENNIKDAEDQTNVTIESGKNVWNQGSYMLHNPETIIQGVVYLGIEKGISALKSVLASLLSEGMANVYIQQNGISAEEYLKGFGVRNAALDYGESSLFDDADRRMIDIVVEYDIDIFFFKLFLKDPSVHMVQRVMIPAWLDGDGISYDG